MGVPADLRLRVPPRPTAPLAQPAKIGDPQDFKVVNVIDSPINTGAIATESKRIGFNGTIVSVQITNVANNDRKQGDTWAQSEVYRGLISDPEQPNQNKLYTLCRGQVTANRGPSGFGALPVMAGDFIQLRSWNRLSGAIGLKLQGLPGPTLPPNWAGEFQNPEGPDIGRIRTIDLGDPDAGSEYTTVAVPANVRWKVGGFQGTLVCDANAANRQPQIIYTDGTDQGITNTTGAHVAASTTTPFSASLGAGEPFINDDPPNAGKTVNFPLANVWLDETYEVTFNTDNFQAGDNWGDGQLFVEERLLAQ